MKKNHFFPTVILLSFSAFSVFAQGFNSCYQECQQLYPYQAGADSYSHSQQVNACVNECQNNLKLQNEQAEQEQRIEEQEDRLLEQENMMEEQVDENQKLESRIKQLEKAQEESEFENNEL